MRKTPVCNFIQAFPMNIYSLQEHTRTGFVLFHAVEHPDPILLWGEPVDPNVDVGLVMASQPPVPVQVRVWDMKSPGDPDAKPTTEILTIKTLFCPIDTKRDLSETLAGELDQVSRDVRQFHCYLTKAND
jgi:hypothetical protein